MHFTTGIASPALFFTGAVPLAISGRSIDLDTVIASGLDSDMTEIHNTDEQGAEFSIVGKQVAV